MLAAHLYLVANSHYLGLMLLPGPSSSSTHGILTILTINCLKLSHFKVGSGLLESEIMVIGQDEGLVISPLALLYTLQSRGILDGI